MEGEGSREVKGSGGEAETLRVVAKTTAQHQQQENKRIRNNEIKKKLYYCTIFN